MNTLGEPSISVVLCVNNYNPWIKSALDSIFNQDDSNFEFLIAANACTDEFWQELQNLTKHDDRVRLFRTSIGQLAFNLNFLADQAYGDYLVRMDADDVCTSNRISALRHTLANNALDILGSAVFLIDGEDTIVGQMNFPKSTTEILRALKSRTVFCHPSVAIRRQFLLDMRGYLGGYYSEDTDLWLRARRMGARMYNLPDTLLFYRVHSQQSIGSRTGYAEVSSHWLREFFLQPSFYNLCGITIAIIKSIFSRFLPRTGYYKR